MSIRYYVDLPCKPREDLDPEELLRLVLLRDRATSLQGRFEEKGILDPAAMLYRERVVTPTGEETRERTVASLIDECAPLEPLAIWCRKCPAAVMPGEFGCTWQVSLPISNAAQCWLVERLTLNEPKSLALFRQSVEELGYGRNDLLKRWRSAGFLEGEQPPSIELDDFRPDADMVLSELFLVGDIMPNHGLGILLHLGALRSSDGRTGDALLELIETITSSGSAEDAPTIELGLAAEEGDDQSTRELKQFLSACFLALELQVPLAIRL